MPRWSDYDGGRGPDMLPDASNPKIGQRGKADFSMPNASGIKTFGGGKKDSGFSNQSRTKTYGGNKVDPGFPDSSRKFDWGKVSAPGSPVKKFPDSSGDANPRRGGK